MNEIFGIHGGYGCGNPKKMGRVVFVFIGAIGWCVAASRSGNRLAAMSLETCGFQLAL
jgi:hypothetical protein